MPRHTTTLSGESPDRSRIDQLLLEDAGKRAIPVRAMGLDAG